jgi:hypothetical protein
MDAVTVAAPRCITTLALIPPDMKICDEQIALAFGTSQGITHMFSPGLQVCAYSMAIRTDNITLRNLVLHRL